MAYSAEVKEIHDRTIRRVRKMWGKAGEYQCYLCFDRACEWAWLWRTHSPSDPEGFIPLCLIDHDDYDDVPQRLRLQAQDPELRAANSARMYRMWRDPEFRTRMSEKARQQWQDPEFLAIQAERRHRQTCSGCCGPIDKFNRQCPVCIRRKHDRRRGVRL